jgi:hypothetical protein
MADGTPQVNKRTAPMRYFWRSLSIAWTLSLLLPGLASAADGSGYSLMTAYTLRNYQEKTPDTERKLLEDSYYVTAATRISHGLSFGLSYLNHSKKAPEGSIHLQGAGLSVGYIGHRFLSVLYTYMPSPKLRYDFKSTNSSTHYYGGQGSMLDIGLHAGLIGDWLHVGPRVTLIEAHYAKTKAETTSGSTTSDLEGSPWRDRWVESYICFWFFF